MSYTDLELITATQIAYIDFDIKYILCRNGRATLRELLELMPEYPLKLQEKLLNANDEISRAQIKGKLAVYDRIMSLNSVYGNWRITSVMDDNMQTGFYACMITTENKKAIIAFRGSEGFHTQLVQDWIEADLGLLNSIETTQQKRTGQYMQILWQRYGSAYDNFAMTGHSLGGNLAFHAGISLPLEMLKKVTQIICFDGPGFSDEYIRFHTVQIKAAAPKMTRYQWSIIGGLLNPLPGTENETVKIKPAPPGEELKYILFCHDTCFVEFTPDGSVIKAPPNPLIEGAQAVSSMIDDVTNEIGILGAFEFLNLLTHPLSAAVMA